jgi:hypothetical protein
MNWETEEDIVSKGSWAEIEKGGDNILSLEHKEEIEFILHRYMDFLRSSITTTNN